MRDEDLHRTRVEIPGTNNVRNLGGLPTRDGRRLRPGRFYRSEALAEPGASEVHAIWDAAHTAHYEALRLATVIDLRTPQEDAAVPSAWKRATGADVVSLPLNEGGEGSDTYVMGELLSGVRTGFSAEDMAELYAGSFDRRADVYAATARILADPARTPALVHCSAGKDRTGTVVALLLEALGVPRDVVVRDYALTGVFRPGRVHLYADLFAERGIDLDDVRVLFETPAAAMESALEHVDRTYGGAARYLVDHAGLGPEEVEAMRHNLLTPPEPA